MFRGECPIPVGLPGRAEIEGSVCPIVNATATRLPSSQRQITREQTLFAAVTLTLTVDPMTLIYERDVAMLKAYVLAKNELSAAGQGFQQLQHYRETDRHADSCD